MCWRRIALIVLLVIGPILGYLLTCTVLSAWVFGLGHGDSNYARTWKQRIEALPDPATAKVAYPEIEATTFPNGEWVFGVSSDSHGSHWGGTIVIKDSTGKVHVYFGHVCGPHRLEACMFHQCKSLEEFYRHDDWQVFGLREQN